MRRAGAGVAVMGAATTRLPVFAIAIDEVTSPICWRAGDEASFSAGTVCDISCDRATC